MTFTPEVWEGVLRRIQNEVPDFAYRVWLEPLRAGGLHDARPQLLCPSRFHSERIRKDFLPRIHAHLRQELGEDVEVQLGVATDRGGLNEVPRTSPKGEAEPSTPARSVEAGPGTALVQPRKVNQRGSTSGARGEKESPQTLSFSFENFVVGSCNALAREVAWALAHDQQRGLSQVYLRSDSGMGKTHLARAVAAETQRAGGCPATYTSAESFTNQFLSSLRTKRTHEFMRRYRGGRRLLVVEDVQFLEGKSATQLEFFHTVQHVLNAGGKVMLTGDRMPREMSQISERIRSQIGSGFVAELEPPDAQVRRAILRSKASHGGVHLPGDCLDVLVESTRGSVRDLEGVLIQLVTSASLLKQPIDLDLTRRVVQQRAGAETRKRSLPLGEVIGAVARFFGQRPESLASRSRKREVLLPRQIAMYLCQRYSEAGLGEIGQALGRDHPSVRNAIAKIERGILEKPPLRYQIEALGERLDDLATRQPD